MGKIDGFLTFDRKVSTTVPPRERITNYHEFHKALPPKEQQLQGGRCMNCGVPFCQSGYLFGGMVSGCPLHNMIPEWNDLIWKGKWELALRRLISTNRFRSLPAGSVRPPVKPPVPAVYKRLRFRSARMSRRSSRPPIAMVGSNRPRRRRARAKKSPSSAAGLPDCPPRNG